ncbi:hypothetical protein IWZ03DRAFT_233288 [Phyllosticta citriasiana]|uniref:Major facilitator superfamily (MFS) profile domain-containing protein n=1 Tax=Phyllosticta citriasiana TaxID=595635 RepID=A0ABR1KHN7_9PEZI
MFVVHERGRALSVYLFGQQLGRILGLITGGSGADALGWRWAQYISTIINGGVLLLLLFTFEETTFPRFLFNNRQGTAAAAALSTVPQAKLTNALCPRQQQ